jgi:ribosomal-protein-alanine N-acetyltransferase
MSGSSIKIRQFRAADLDTLCRIDRICFSGDIAFSRAELSFYLNHPKSIARVATRAGLILGFVLARIESPVIAHIITLDIVPEARRHGIGTCLMEVLHEILAGKGVKTAYLEVATDNVAAQRLYEKMNYRYLATLSGYYHEKADAYRMACSFPRGAKEQRGKGIE